MTFKMSVLHKKRECKLVHRRHRACVKTEPLFKLFQKRKREHHVADAKCGRERLCKRVQVNHAVNRVDACKRWNHTAGQAELCVVVVLDDVAAVACGSPA